MLNWQWDRSEACFSDFMPLTTSRKWVGLWELYLIAKSMRNTHFYDCSGFFKTQAGTNNSYALNIVELSPVSYSALSVLIPPSGLVTSPLYRLQTYKKYPQFIASLTFCMVCCTQYNYSNLNLWQILLTVSLLSFSAAGHVLLISFWYFPYLRFHWKI